MYKLMFRVKGLAQSELQYNLVNYAKQSSILFHPCTTTVSLETTHLIALCE